ncbi:DNA-processing protein DprA [Propionibacteriaceae bacterium Y2011]
MIDKEARMALSWTFDAGDPKLTETLVEQPATEVWRHTLAGDLGAGPQRRATAYDRAALTQLARRSDVRFVVPGDDEWPDRLSDLVGPDPVAERGGCPAGLWLRGAGHLREWVGRAVAVVGSRACSPYGQETATDIAAGVAEAGWSVVSGGAYGIDVAAHRGALAAGGRTIAVLACGPDIEYPRGNLLVLQTLAEDHLVVSETPPGCHPTRIRFLARNRLIAALSTGTVMVEAAARSGARNTMNWATALGRQAMAVPGSVHSALSVGPHHLLREHQAELVTSAEDVLELVAPMGDHLTSPRRGAVRRVDVLDPGLRPVYEALPARGYRTAGEVALATGRTVPASLAGLSALEHLGMAEPHDGGWRAVPMASS